MERQGSEVHVDEVEASGGSKEGVVRYILIIGTVLAIVALTITWMTGAFTHDGYEDQSSPAGAETPVTDAGMDEAKVLTDQTELQDGLEVIEN